jgi:hypothetical protein
MDVVLGQVGGQPAKAFYDDVQIPGTDWSSNWQDTLATLQALTQAGFMLNLKKC